MAKINLILAKNNSFYCDGIFSIGVYIKEKKAVLIDSGISKDVAKEIDKLLTHDHIQIEAIINTHCHGDHCGGNAFFQQKYPKIKIFSTETEKPFIEDPLLAPICFCGGAAAFEGIKKCKPIAPQQPSKVTELIAPYEDQKILICDEKFEIITLPGHTRGMVAVKSPDNVLYCGDAVFGGDTFRKYPILFYTFIGDTLKSFKKLRALIPSMDAIILYHGGKVDDLGPLINDHEKLINETKNTILSMLREGPLSIEEITAKIMQTNEIPDDLISYVLTKTPIQAYLAELEHEKLVEIRVTKGIRRAQIIDKIPIHLSHEAPAVML
ncbi:MAG: MBL fold metallo-hydrolase [Parachlamydiaceae bacterium]|nr:MBL fold metallo-hydrolase [Parachlamydiaceae bacterium]